MQVCVVVRLPAQICMYLSGSCFFSLLSLAFSFRFHLLSSWRAHWELHGASLGDKTRASGFLSGEKDFVIVRLLELTAL